MDNPPSAILKPAGIVTLITDFGLEGEYAGAMKGAILQVNPRCQVVDITHRIGPQDVWEAAFVLKNTYPYFPPGTVHVAVVDPGVGSRRRPVVLRKGQYFFIGPDNGVFSFVLSGKGRSESYEIARKRFFLRPLSHTFHGRDVFGPVAGHLSRGLHPSLLGPPVRDLMSLERPQPILQGKKLRGRILRADPFGNLITNISREEYGKILADRPLQMKGRGWRIARIHFTYSEVQPGEPVALFGSTGLLEISVNRGSALKDLGLKPGDLLTVTIL